MRETQQRSLRLSRYHLGIIEKIRDEKGLNFTDAVKHIISEFANSMYAENSAASIIRKLDAKISMVNSAYTEDEHSSTDAILDELQEIGKKINLISNAVCIIGSANSRTIVAIEELFNEDAE